MSAIGPLLVCQTKNVTGQGLRHIERMDCLISGAMPYGRVLLQSDIANHQSADEPLEIEVNRKFIGSEPVVGIPPGRAGVDSKHTLCV